MARQFHKAAAVYAKTLLEFAIARKQEEELREDFAALREAFQKNPALERAVTLKGLSDEKRARILKPVAERASEVLKRLLDLLESKGRLELLPSIGAAYLRLDEEARNIRHARIVSAKPLNEEQLKTLSGALSARRAGADFTLHNDVDDSLIAGFRVEEEGYVTDASLKHKLDGIRQRLAAA